MRDKVMSKGDPMGPVPRPSQEVRDPPRRTTPRQSQEDHNPSRRNLEEPSRRHEHGSEHHSRNSEHPSCRPAIDHQAPPPARDIVPPGPTKSQEPTHALVPIMPRKPAEAVAQAQVLLNFPPPAHQMEQWRATIQSLLSFANNNRSERGESLHRRQTDPTWEAGEWTGEHTATVHSQQYTSCRN